MKILHPAKHILLLLEKVSNFKHDNTFVLIKNAYLRSRKLKDKNNMKVGDKVPEVLGRDENGNEVKMSDFKGKKLVLYFYPKDNTSGCTAEACSIRDNYEQLQAEGYEVLGVSVQDENSHKKFIEKQQLPFHLIADTEKTLNEAFGVWAEKSMYGRKYFGTLRTTFIIDENGVIERVILPKEIKTKIHGEQILAK